MQIVYILQCQPLFYKPAGTYGVYDSEDKALEAKQEAESLVSPNGSKRFHDVWIDKMKVNQTKDFGVVDNNKED